MFKRCQSETADRASGAPKGARIASTRDLELDSCGAGFFCPDTAMMVTGARYRPVTLNAPRATNVTARSTDACEEAGQKIRDDRRLLECRAMPAIVDDMRRDAKAVGHDDAFRRGP